MHVDEGLDSQMIPISWDYSIRYRHIMDSTVVKKNFKIALIKMLSLPTL